MAGFGLHRPAFCGEPGENADGGLVFRLFMPGGGAGIAMPHVKNVGFRTLKIVLK